MSGLAPNLFDRRFQDFVQIGRARLRALAPEWTDHNAHDPGITLMELLAWVAEAQLFSVSKLRRDERASYATLLGLTTGGTQGARGLIWSDREDPNSPVTTFARTVVIPNDAVVNVTNAEAPTFRPTNRLLWVPGRLEALETRTASGATIDHTVANNRGGPAFLPFGEEAGRRDRLAMTFVAGDDGGLFGGNRRLTNDALWAIGVRAAAPSGGAGAESVGNSELADSSLVATLIADGERFPARIVSDTTAGLLTTGALLLDLSPVTSSPVTFTLELRAARGFARPPRLVRIEPNVIPIYQGRVIADELNVSNGQPDWNLALRVPGLRFAPGSEAVKVDVVEDNGPTTWQRTDRLSESGPDDPDFELDAALGEITFGNGINGRIPPANAQVFVSYAVSDGDQGVVARNRKWTVAGFAGSFGVNLDPITGGAQPSSWVDQRRDARKKSLDEHALVSADDIAAAAKALPLLEVARTWVVAPSSQMPRTGVVKLIALRSRVNGVEPDQVPETPRWRETIRRRLAPRMPLATRLQVSAPRYVEFSIEVVVESNAGLDPAEVKAAIERTLRQRLALVASPGITSPRQPGVPLTEREVRAWIRATAGVARVTTVHLRLRDGTATDEIAVARDGLPRWKGSSIEVQRPAAGGRR